MSNYTITTNFGAKDDLPSGNAAKVIKGSEFTTEFTNIKTAVNSKADSVSPTFTGDTALNGTTTFGPDGTSTFNGTVNFTKDVTFDTNTMFVDVSANRVGIGTTSPLYNLVVNDSASAVIQIRSGNDDAGHLYFADTDDDNIGGVSYSHQYNFMNFKTNDTERMRIDSSGNVGIGTDSPNRPLTVESSDVGLAEFESTNSTSKVYFKDSGTTNTYSVAVGSVGDGMAFYASSGGAERMRIDSSGHLLVGTTEIDVGYTDSGAGFSAHPDGFIQSARSSVNANLYLNKLDNDGEIINFRKDGIPVGSIGTITNRLHIGSGNTFITFYNDGNSIYPAQSNGTLRDNAIDIGTSSGRFKDLYLSGGIEFGGSVNSGGTVSTSNKLDDYEEGVFTPSLTFENSNTGLVLGDVAGAYTKVGRMVVCNIRGAISTVGSSSGDLRLTGLPFAVGGTLSTTALESVGNVSFLANVTVETNNLGLVATENTSYARFAFTTSGNVADWLSSSHVTSGFDFRASLTYFTS